MNRYIRTITQFALAIGLSMAASEAHADDCRTALARWFDRAGDSYPMKFKMTMNRKDGVYVSSTEGTMTSDGSAFRGTGAQTFSDRSPSCSQQNVFNRQGFDRDRPDSLEVYMDRGGGLWIANNTWGGGWLPYQSQCSGNMLYAYGQGQFLSISFQQDQYPH